MNINRLKKIEKKFRENDSNFCICHSERVNELIDSIYAGNSANEIDFASLPENWCDKCGLPVNTELIKEIDLSIALIYGDGSADLIGQGVC